LLKLLNVTYQYPTGGGVEGVTLEVQAGEFLLLVGKTGVGKTTILRLISLELRPQTGDVALEQYRARDIRPRNLPKWRRRLGVVYQDLRLLNDRSALENVILAAQCETNLPGKPRERAMKVLSNVGLASRLHQMPYELSAGEQQRAALARALVNEPFLLLADEPVSHLDQVTSDDIVALMRKVNLAGTAMLVSTHQPERFDALRPRVIKIESGRVSGL
jgi:cell division transport system ATP-binding protein